MKNKVFYASIYTLLTLLLVMMVSLGFFIIYLLFGRGDTAPVKYELRENIQIRKIPITMPD
jgi:hypothetical protein